MNAFKKTRIASTLLPALCMTLAGCMVGPKYHAPTPTANGTAPPPPAYREAPDSPTKNAAISTDQIDAQTKDRTAPINPQPGAPAAPQTAPAQGWKPAQPGDAMLKGKWWEIYNDPELNALEEQVDINNQNIKQYFENFMEARALIAEARSQLYPTVSTSPGYTKTRASANLGSGISSGGTPSGTMNQVLDLPLDISWTPDLWGRVRNEIRNAQYNAQISQADLENERLTEQATLAITFFEIRGQDALIDLYRATVKADTDALDLARARYETGVDDRISVVEAQSTLDNVTASLANLSVARAQYEHAIAMLIGGVASNVTVPARSLNAEPPAVPIGLPSQLLERRPDIAAAERNMAAANAEIGIAYAAYYPELTLTAGGGFESSTFKHLVDWGSRFWSLGGTVDETIFDAGLRRATVHQYVAIYNADIAAYRQTVLTAFQQTEDYLAAVRILSDQMIAQQRGAKAAEEALQLELGRYQTGIDPYLDVVTAQTTLLNSQQSVASLRTQQMTASVQLIEALGGGWDITQLPTPQQVSAKPTKDQTTQQQ